MEIAEAGKKSYRNVPTFSKKIEGAGNPVKAVAVVNALNRINFQGGQVFVKLRHVWSGAFFTVTADPSPVNDAGVKLSLGESGEVSDKDLTAYEYRGMFYSDGLKMVWVKARLISMDSHGITLASPEGGEEVSERSCRRAICSRISTKISQGIINLEATLKDFSAIAFAVEVSREQFSGVRRVNLDMPLNITLDNGENVLFEATCRIVRILSSDLETTFVVAPVSTNIKRFKPKEYRSFRHKLTPQPCIEFQHPLLGKKISLKALDISGSGVSVEEDSANSLLMPGMVIPEMAIIFANSFRINCAAQVLYSRYRKESESVQAGLSFTAMSGEDQLQLSSILYQVKNERSFVGNSIDIDDLWDFFFETGFVYPKKYLSLEAQKEDLKSLYSRLYSGSPDIARHITYRDKGIIYGHVSMFRFYRKTWLMHHHAAIRSSQHKAGLVVMDHILQHINDVNHFADAAMKYIACYFRPNNRFANRVFGGASKSLQDPLKSSLDEFAYFHFDSRGERDLPSDWILGRSSREDLGELKSFYNKISGGLMLKALDLEKKDGLDEKEINASYAEQGLKREREFYSLKAAEGCLAALFILNFSDVGLNMSSLTNCIQVIVIDQERVGYNKIENVLTILNERFEDNPPVLIFPRSYADDKDLPYDNVYTLGILDLNYISKFLGFMEGLTKSKLQLAKKTE